MSNSGYGRRARILSLGVASTGLVTFAYFSVASRVLSDVDYKQVAVLWSVMFVIATVIYRPIEQLLARTIAERNVRGQSNRHPLRNALGIQLSFAVCFLALTLLFRHQLQDELFNGSHTLYWILVSGVLAYAASYFARGWLAGNQRVGLYGGLMLMESCSRLLFALAVAVGIAEGQSTVAMGMAAAPFVSLVVVPFAFSRHRTRSGNLASKTLTTDSNRRELKHNRRFAGSVFTVMLSEQILLNAAVLIINATSPSKAAAGYVFNAFLIVRAPLQLFQAVQGSLLPHLSKLHAISEHIEFHRAVRKTALTIGGFALIATGGLLLIGPFAMEVLFDSNITYNRFGLALIGLGMGAHLIAGTLNQAALARNRAGTAAIAWLFCACLFCSWMFTPIIANPLFRAEVGYLLAATLLWFSLWVIYKRSTPTSVDAESDLEATEAEKEHVPA